MKTDFGSALDAVIRDGLDEASRLGYDRALARVRSALHGRHDAALLYGSPARAGAFATVLGDIEMIASLSLRSNVQQQCCLNAESAGHTEDCPLFTGSVRPGHRADREGLD